MSRNYGYQGFRSWSQQLQPSMKPGETRQTLAGKFSSVGHGSQYSRPEPVERQRDMTMNDTFKHVRGGDYKVPDRRGVSVMFDSEPTTTRSKPFLAQTTYGSNFPNYRRQVAAMGALEPDQYEAAFRALDRDESGYIDSSEVAALFRGGCGGEVPQWAMEKFVRLFDTNEDGRVSWAEFAAGLAKIAALMDQDTTKRGTTIPEWLEVSRKQPTHVLTAPAFKSCNQNDIGMANQIPSQRGYTFKAGMRSTTQDMFEGTTKDTYQIPGYGGFMPISKRNPAATAQGNAEQPRAVASNLRLYHRHNVPGYTGHNPTNVRNDKGERLSGAHPSTTSGAASLGLIV